MFIIGLQTILFPFLKAFNISETFRIFISESKFLAFTTSEDNFDYCYVFSSNNPLYFTCITFNIFNL